MDFSVFDDYEVDGQFSLFDYTRPTFKIDKPVRLIELFGGIGSQSMALERLGVNFEHYRLIEFDKYPVASYNAIHGTNFEPMDITKIKGSNLGIVDCDKYTYLLTYSFPCTDLSVAGKMQGMSKEDWENGNSTRSGLLWEVERLLNEVEHLPHVLVMENVTQVHSEQNIKDFRKWLEFLEKKGYSNFYQDMNAKNYGVAQNRYRTIMVSILGEWNFKFPSEIPLKKVMKDYLEDEVDKKYYITSEKAQKLIDTLILEGKILTDRKPRSEQKCIYCENLLGKKGSLGMCNKHYIQYKRWGDPLHSDNKERATVDGYYRDGKTGRREHRVLYEKYYNEKLLPDEIIHHINFVKTDNRIENLYKYKNASEHIKAHRKYEKLLENLDANEEIYFLDGNYYKREREREHPDRQSTYALKSQESSKTQIASKQDTMTESATYRQTEVEFANTKEYGATHYPHGWLEPMADFSGTVPTIDSGIWKHHTLLIEKEKVNQLGFIEKGTGKHQSNTVYGSDGLSPTLSAGDYKEPVKVIECKKMT